MKRLFFSILIFFTVIPLFAVELQHDIFLGESSGLDTAFVFGNGKVKNGVGLYYDTHNSITMVYYDYRSSDYRIPEPITVQSFGVYYQLDWSTTFFNIGPVGFGIDLPLQIGIGYDSGCGLNLLGNLCPSTMFKFNKFDLFLGYKFTTLLYEAVTEKPFIKSSVTLGIRYNLNKGSSGKISGITTKLEAPDSSSNSKVNIIPGNDIKTIYE